MKLRRVMLVGATSVLLCGPVLADSARAPAVAFSIEAQPLEDALAEFARQSGDDLVEDTARRIASLRATPEAKEGLAAFLDKRPAAWVPV